jgi:hypothetical protein
MLDSMVVAITFAVEVASAVAAVLKLPLLLEFRSR